MLSTIRSMIFAMLQGNGITRRGRCDPLASRDPQLARQNGVAYVHVSKPNVEVTVDDTEYHIETL